MRKEDVPICIEMTLESFGTKDYTSEEFVTIEDTHYIM